MRILWIGKQPTTAKGGDEVFDLRAIAACRARGHDVTLFHPAKVGRWMEVTNILKGLPYYRTRYTSNANIERARQLAADYDAVVCSWEPFDALAIHLDAPLIMILHNVTSRSLAAIFPNNPLVSLAVRRARQWEQRYYKRDTLPAIAVLSKRDGAFIKGLAEPPTVFMTIPGMPPSIQLERDSSLRKELVISGTFDWMPKRRDVIHFARSYRSIRNQLPVISDSLPREVQGMLNTRPVPPLSDYARAMRFGLVTDRFESGHKLKTLSYIANNQIVMSFSDISFDFEDIPDNELFIRRVHSVEEMMAHIKYFDTVAIEDLRDRFIRFKDQCVKSFTWDAVAAQITRIAEKLVQDKMQQIESDYLCRSFLYDPASVDMR